MTYYSPYSNTTRIKNCPFEKSCPYLGGESPTKVLNQRNYLRNRVNQMEGLFNFAQNEITKLKERITQLEGENGQLLENLSQAKHTIKKIFPKRKPSETSGKRGAPKGHPGTSRKKPESIDEYIAVPLDKCPDCNSPDISLCKNFTTHLQEDIVFKVITSCFIHLRYWCHRCKKIVYAFGENELPKSPIGPVAKAIAALIRYQIKISYDDVKRIFQIFGLTISPGAFVGFDNKMYQKGLSLYEAIKSMLPYTSSVNVDETGWKKKWLWNFSPKQLDLSYYHVDESRGGKVVKEHLGEDYKGILGSDFFSAYNNSINAFGKQKCNAHLLRDIKDLEEAYPENSVVLSFCQDLKELMQNAILLHSQFSKLTPEKWNVQKKDIFSRFKDLWKNPISHPTADTLRKRLLRHKDEILTFLDHPKIIDPTNNICERALRNLVIFRKITFGNRSEQGEKNLALMATILASSKLKGLDQKEVLKTLLLKGLTPELSQKFGLPQPRAP